MKKKISICIPVFNEADNLPVAIRAVEQLFSTRLSSYELEIIVTDNASTDQTWAVIQDLAVNRPHMKAYLFSRNFGYQNSVYGGLCLSSGDAVVELDADLEDPPEVIVQFVQHWEGGYDVVYGVRESRYAHWWMKIIFAVFYQLLRKASDIEIATNAGDFRLLDRKVVDVLKSLSERNLYLRGLVAYLGFRQLPVQYQRNPRLSGQSKFSLIHYFVLAIDAFTAFSKTPLRAIGIMGVVLFCLSTLLSVFYIAKYCISGTPIPGFTTLVTLLLFLHSITFIFLGILGEYLSRIFDDSKYRPRVIIQKAINIQQFPTIL